MGEIIKRHDKPLGASGTDVTGKVHNTEDHIEALQGYQAALIYDKMRRSDTQVRKILNAIKSHLRAAKWSIEPYDDDPKSLEIAGLVEHILFKDIKWSKFVNEALTMIEHGHSIFEIVDKNVVSKEFGPYTGLAQLGFRRQSTIIEWTHDEMSGELLRIKQESNTDIKVNTEIPAEFLLLFFSEQEGDNIGFPLLRNVYGPYKRKLLATELQFIGIERFAIPTPILKVPKNVTQADAEYIEAVAVLKNFTSAEDSYLTYPEGWELELHNNSFDPEKLTKVIKSEDENMTSAILASFLELGTGGNTGAYSLSADLSDFFFNGLIYYANIIVDTINSVLIPRIINLNFGPDEVAMPALSFSGITDNAGKELMEVLTGFTTSGLINADEPLEDYIRKLYNLPKKVEGTMIENEGEVDAQPIDTNDNSDDNDIDPADDSEPEASAQLSENLKFAEAKNNPKALMEKYDAIILEVIRRHLTIISDKYIADVLKNYNNLSAAQKIKAATDVKIGGTAQFKKELRGVFTSLARETLDQVESEVGLKNVKFKEQESDLLKEFNVESFKFNDFSKLPKRVQLLIASQAQLITEKEAKEVADVVAFQFGSSEPTTNDIAVLKEDLKLAAADRINSGNKQTVAANASATVLGNTRNEYLLSEDVQGEIASYTFVNSDPKTEICRTLAGTTYDVLSTDIVRYQPPLHHNAVLEDTLVMTDKGQIRIDELSKGDLVLTHDNRFMPITEVMTRFEDKFYYEIELDNGKKINITGEHPVLTKRGWVQVFDLNLNDDIVCLEDIYNG